MESCKYGTIWALCWWHDRPHRRRRIQWPDNPFNCSSNGHGTCEAYSHQLSDDCVSLCHECGEDHPDSLSVGWGNCQDWSSPETLRPSTSLPFSGKWIISTIVSIPVIVHQALAKITSSHAAIVYRCKTTINSIYWLWTQSPTDIRTMVPWLLAMDRFTCPTNVPEVSSKIPSCLIVVLTINLGMQVSICSDWNCAPYSLVIHLWHTANGNERQIIDW